MKVYLGLGSNVGPRAEILSKTIGQLSGVSEITVRAVSSVYETAPVGDTNQADFLNLVVEIETTLPPQALLRTLKQIEAELGRVETWRWGPRVIDIDILLYGDIPVIVEGLTIPHPHFRERRFVLAPLAELAPEEVDPVTRLRMKDLLQLPEVAGEVRCVGPLATLE